VPRPITQKAVNIVYKALEKNETITLSEVGFVLEQLLINTKSGLSAIDYNHMFHESLRRAGIIK